MSDLPEFKENRAVTSLQHSRAHSIVTGLGHACLRPASAVRPALARVARTITTNRATNRPTVSLESSSKSYAIRVYTEK